MDKPFSHHIFLFPFKWDYLPEGQKSLSIPFLDRLQLKDVESQIEAQVRTTRWEAFFLSNNEARNYNEYQYFYPQVRPVLFGPIEWEKEITPYVKSKSDDRVLLQYRLGVPTNEWKYQIKLVNGTTFKLAIEDITLNIYETGVGILGFHLSNYEASAPEDILLINDFGRRIYPQYLTADTNMVSAVKSNFLADKITIFDQTKIIVEDDFSAFSTSDSLQYNIRRLPDHIMKILGDNFRYDLKDEHTSIFISPVIDDRMFTICWYGDNNMQSSLQKSSGEGKHRLYEYISNQWWHKFIFVDGKTPGSGGDTFLENLNKLHTYDRWVKDYSGGGTLFGISRYSFVMLTAKNWFTENILLRHVQTVYFQLVMLALVQRASVMRFSQEVTSKSTLDEPSIKRLSQTLQHLHKKYLQFINRMYFREVTAQEQGIDLYKILCDKMELEKNIKDLNQEIDELHEYVSIEEQREQTFEINRLTKIAAIFLPVSLAVGILGMNSLQVPEDFFTPYIDTTFWKSMSIVGIGLILGLILALVNFKNK